MATKVEVYGPEKYCDICTHVDKSDSPNVAIVDGKTTMGPWANMCWAHFEVLGVGLGTGKGQRLEYVTEEG